MPSVIEEIPVRKLDLIPQAPGAAWKCEGCATTESKPLRAYLVERTPEGERWAYRVEFGGGSVEISHPYVQVARDEHFQGNMALFRVSGRADVKVWFYEDRIKQEIWLHADPQTNVFDEIFKLENLSLAQDEGGHWVYLDQDQTEVGAIPPAVVRAFNADREEVYTTEGTIEVIPREDTSFICRITVDPDWLAERFAAGDTVVIDPSLVLSGATINTTWGGHRMARLSDGTLYSALTSSGEKLYVSKNGGTAWTLAYTFPVAKFNDIAVKDDVLFAVGEPATAANGMTQIYRLVPSADRLSVTATIANVQTAGGGATVSYLFPQLVLGGVAGGDTQIYITWNRFESGASNYRLQTQQMTCTAAGAFTRGAIVSLTSDQAGSTFPNSVCINNGGNVYVAFGLGGAISTIPFAGGATTAVTGSSGIGAKLIPLHGLSDCFWICFATLISRTAALVTIPSTTLITGSNSEIAAIAIPNSNLAAVAGKRGSGVANPNYLGVLTIDLTTYAITDRGAVQTTTAYAATPATQTINGTTTGDVPILWLGASGPYYDTFSVNLAPLTPDGLAPDNGAGFNGGASITLTATAHDSAGDYPTDAMWEISDVAGAAVNYITAAGALTAAPTWVPATGGTFSLSRLIAAGALANGKTWRWRVQSRDVAGAVSPWSAYAQFKTSAPPVAAFVSPAAGVTITTRQVAISCTVSDAEGTPLGTVAYRIYADNAGAKGALLDSSTVGALSKTLPLDLTPYNGQTVWLEIQPTDADGITGNAVAQSNPVSLTPPPTPLLSAVGDGANGRIRVTITNPAPGGGQPDTATNDLYRQEPGGAFIRIATALAKGAVYDDYAVASGVNYTYQVMANGTNTATSTSATATANAILSGIWLHDVADPAGTALRLKRGIERGENWDGGASLSRFAGRRLPVAEYSEQVDGQFPFSVLMESSDGTWSLLRALLRRRGTFCVRDSSGRKAFGVIPSYSEKDEIWNGQSVPLVLTETDYRETV